MMANNAGLIVSLVPSQLPSRMEALRQALGSCPQATVSSGSNGVDVFANVHRCRWVGVESRPKPYSLIGVRGFPSDHCCGCCCCCCCCCGCVQALCAQSRATTPQHCVPTHAHHIGTSGGVQVVRLVAACPAVLVVRPQLVAHNWEQLQQVVEACPVWRQDVARLGESGRFLLLRMGRHRCDGGPCPGPSHDRSRLPSAAVTLGCAPVILNPCLSDLCQGDWLP